MRQAFFKKAEESLEDTYFDDFFVQIIQEVKSVTQKQIECYRKSNKKEKLVGLSLGDFVCHLAGKN